MKRYMAPAALIVTLLLTMVCGCIDDGSGDEGPLEEQENSRELVYSPVALDEGQTGTLSIPIIGINFIDTDVKHHWDMPKNISGVRVNLSCIPGSWNLELSLGTGDCPHSGMEMNSTTGTSGELSVQFWTRGNHTLETGQWFCHIAVEDPASHRGESLEYVFEVTLFSFEEIDCEDGVCPA